MNEPAPQGQEWLGELESLRGLAALLVMLFHMPQWYPPFHAIPLIRNGGFMVDFFFVLSGFVICRAYGSRLSGARDILRFQLLRLGRLYPVHAVFLILFLLIEIVRLMMVYSGLATSGIPPFSYNNPTALGLHIFLLQALSSPSMWGTFNAPAWTISIEFYGYLLFALVTVIAGRFRFWSFAVLMLIGFAMQIFNLGDNANIARFLSGFFAGCLVSQIVAKRAGALDKRLTPISIGLLILITCLKPNSPGSILWITAGSALAIAAVTLAKESWVSRILRRPALMSLGALSYTIYMAHFLVIYLASQLVGRFSSAPKAIVDGNLLPQPGLAIALLWMTLVVTATLFISVVTHRFVENTVRCWTRTTVARYLGPL